MTKLAAEVVRQALALDEEDRAEIVAQLLESLEGAGPNEGSMLVAVLERRAAELEAGDVQGVPWEEVRAGLIRGSASRVARGRPCETLDAQLGGDSYLK